MSRTETGIVTTVFLVVINTNLMMFRMIHVIWKFFSFSSALYQSGKIVSDRLLNLKSVILRATSTSGSGIGLSVLPLCDCVDFSVECHCVSFERHRILYQLLIKINQQISFEDLVAIQVNESIVINRFWSDVFFVVLCVKVGEHFDITVLTDTSANHYKKK